MSVCPYGLVFHADIWSNGHMAKASLHIALSPEAIELLAANAQASGKTRQQYIEDWLLGLAKAAEPLVMRAAHVETVLGAGSDKRQYVNQPTRQTKDLAADVTESSVGPQDIVVETSKTHAPAPARATARPAFVSFPKPKDSKRR